MDLIYMDALRRDIGVMKSFTLDLAYGSGENDFELTTHLNNHICLPKYLIYAEGTEYGGIIDTIAVETESSTLKYKGRTWHGLLLSKIIEPDAGENYCTVSGEANAVLDLLVKRLRLESLFAASTVDSGIQINQYQFYRYINGYNGICKMLSAVGAKLHIEFKNGYVVLSAFPIVDYSKDEEFDGSQLTFSIQKNYHPTNHMICLGRGELSERTVIHLYCDVHGNISYEQTQFGVDEVAEVYDYSGAESEEELENGGRERLAEAWNADTANLNLDSANVYDVGDIVGARENVTGVHITQSITKKIVTLKNDRVTISYKVGDTA